MISHLLLITAICGFISQCIAAEQKILVIELPFGNIRGYSNEKSWQFYGIPFAKPPVGNLRLQNPEDFETFKDQTLDAKEPKPMCPQDCKDVLPPEGCQDEISEDCLYLNIFVPLSWDKKLKNAFNVLLFIYGGAFSVGSAGCKMYDSRFLSEHTNTIVVTFNYRVGALGFLKLPFSEVKGNMGFMDQRKAMKWVKDYISYFGGDSEAITLFGESAGAISVGAHLVSKGSQNLFHRAIIESNPWTIPLKNKIDANLLGLKFLKKMGCWNTKCLYSKTWEEIIEVQKTLRYSLTFPLDALEAMMVWGPIIDGNELTDQPFKLLSKNKKSKPLIVGTTTHEGNIFVNKIFSGYCKYIPKICYGGLMNALFGKDHEEVEVEYNTQYGAPSNYYKRFARIFGDYAFYCPTRYLSSKMTDLSNNKIYNYVWNVGGVIPGFCYEIPCHGSELSFLFDTAQLSNINFTPEQRDVSSAIETYWGNMAKSGNPNLDHPDLNTPTWSQYGKDRAQMFFDLPESHQITDYEEARGICDFFDEKIGYTRSGAFKLTQESLESFLDDDEEDNVISQDEEYFS